MMMTVSFSEFTHTFHTMDRGNQFSYDALEALYHYLNDTALNDGIDYELDVIELCCEYVEYETAAKCLEEFMPDRYQDILARIGPENPALLDMACREAIAEKYTIIWHKSGLILHNIGQ